MTKQRTDDRGQRIDGAQETPPSVLRSPSSGGAAPAAPCPQRRRSTRELTRATWLRPRDIFELYGIPQSTLCRYSHYFAPERRPPSSFIPGRGGRRGIRLYPREAFEAWINSFGQDGQGDSGVTRDQGPGTKDQRRETANPRRAA